MAMITCPHCNERMQTINERGEVDPVFGVPTCPVCGWSQPEAVGLSHTWIFADGEPLQATAGGRSPVVHISHSHSGYSCPCHLIDSDGNEKHMLLFFYHWEMP